ncbi:hypothetical protein K438DRAFT_2167682 [Mycena galopus ATCC 62051]|nr:hypothetical protein K438DRAFT_2167682 [Mycena galopus ATCC 62051]
MLYEVALLSFLVCLVGSAFGAPVDVSLISHLNPPDNAFRRDIPTDVQAALASELQVLQTQAAEQVASAIAAGETDVTISESSETTVTEAAAQTSATVPSVSLVAVGSAAATPATITDAASATAPTATVETVASRPPVAPPSESGIAGDFQACERAEIDDEGDEIPSLTPDAPGLLLTRCTGKGEDTHADFQACERAEIDDESGEIPSLIPDASPLRLTRCVNSNS